MNTADQERLGRFGILKLLPRMNILGILLGDFLILIGAASGGWVAELWRYWREHASRPRANDVARE